MAITNVKIERISRVVFALSVRLLKNKLNDLDFLYYGHAYEIASAMQTKPIKYTKHICIIHLFDSFSLLRTNDVTSSSLNKISLTEGTIKIIL